MKRTYLGRLYLVVALIGLAQVASAQIATGTPQFGSFGGGPLDTVNLGNLNAHIAIPIIARAGRAGRNFTYNLSYDSSIWNAVGSSGNVTWQPVFNFGWHGQTEATTGWANFTSQITNFCNQQQGLVWIDRSGYVYHDPWGVPHHFAGDFIPANNCNVTPRGFTSQATDGSGYTMSVDVSTGAISLTARDGTAIAAPTSPTGSGTTTDPNGNLITVTSSGFFDTLSATTPILTVSGSGSPSSPVVLQYIPPANESTGTRVSVTINYVQYTVKTGFGAKTSSGAAIGEYGATSVSLVDNITLPDGTKYAFLYEKTPISCSPLPGTFATNCVTGRLAQVTVPTGGTITYGYTGGANGIVNDGTTAGLTRTLTPGGKWTYTRTQDSSMASHWTTTVTTPPDTNNSGSAGNDTIIDFQQDSNTNVQSKTFNFYEVRRQVFQGAQSSNVLLLNTTTCWNGNTSNCTTTAVSSPISQCNVTAQPNSGKQAQAVSFYNGAGLVTERDQYDYGTGGPGSPLRKTSISYANFGNAISDRPSIVTVADGSGNTLSSTTYTYDEYSTYPLQASSGTPQHQTVTNTRGNPTTIVYAVAGAKTLTRHFSYYDTGTVYQSYDVNGAITTNVYSTATQGNTTASCGNSFPTEIDLPISGLSTKVQWDCFGAVPLKVTDADGNSITTTYSDADFWRPASVADPVGATSAFTYTPYNGNTSPVTLANVDSKMLFNSNNSVVEQLTTVNQLGQVVYSQQHEGPTSGNWDSTQAIYDSLLRLSQSTMPCVANQGQGCPSSATTTNSYDALGRVTKTADGGSGFVSNTYNQNDVTQAVGPPPSGESLKQKLLEFDGIGRLTSVCEITQLAAPGVCSQNTLQPNGYWTKHAYSVNSSGNPTVTVTQNAQASSGQQTRVYTYDLLGRLISETNPETNGLTTNYTYDSDSSGTCTGTFNGDLVKRVDTKGNTVCYQYDVIHRVTQVTYPSGPDSTNTPAKTFVYDSATLSGTAMSNAKGHLAEAYTGSSTSKKTDEFFSYSVRGELTDVWESTLNSGGYYHVSATFWENHALKSLGSNVTGVPNQTYGVDAMGRTATVSAGSGQNPVTSTSYNLSTYTYSTTFGSGDSDQFTLDPSTGRTTKYVFNVGSNSDTGQLNWNQNGSLGGFTITDTIPSTSDTQSCSYTHDDLSRISSVGCKNGTTNVWNQNFTYDVFGNITKTVPSGGTGISFQPTYSTSTNWITGLPGGITTTTDNNGQVTYDGTHHYTWDAEGKMLTVDTTTVTHDALGRTVEESISGSFTQIVYGPLGGKFATMSVQTLVKAFIPLPSAQAIYTSTGLTYYRHKDYIGSSRLATTPSRTLYSAGSYGPFGESYKQSGTTDVSFTGVDQDAVSGRYDFAFREYNPNAGRWISPDPAGLAAVNFADPQTWNRFAYVGNSPLARWDDGMSECNYDACVYADSDGSGMPNGVIDIYSLLPASGSSTPVGTGSTGAGGGWPNLPPFNPPLPNKGFCSFTASGVPQASQGAIEQIFNQAGVGIDFIDGPGADLTVIDANLNPNFNPDHPGSVVLGDDSFSNPAMVDFSQSRYPIASGIVTAHEWGHYLLSCLHLGSLPGSCGDAGLMSPGVATFGSAAWAARGMPMYQWSPTNTAFQFDSATGQTDAIKQACQNMHH